MVEKGGPTTQAGIEYQNKIAALYLGDLLQWDEDGRDRAVQVRVEAPAEVDDIVVRYADDHRRWIQAKLRLTPKTSAWTRLWHAFQQQLVTPGFGPEDRLVLALGEHGTTASDLRECASRTRASSDAEWRRRLSGRQTNLIEDIDTLLGSSSHSLFARLDVEIVRDDLILTDVAPPRLPACNVPTASLLAFLQTLAGAEGRRRGTFEAPTLRQQLRDQHGVIFAPPPRWGLPSYLRALAELQVNVPGTHVGGRAVEVFSWPRTVETSAPHSDFDDEQQIERVRTGAPGVDLRYYPTPEALRCIVHAGPGFGKSALASALAQRLAVEGLRPPAIVSLAAFAEVGDELVDVLQTRVNREYSVNIDWLRLCETGAAVILLDGLDEVALERRVDVISRIDRFCRRFPRIAWLLTVRDPAIVPVGFDAPKVELLPLTTADMKPFIKALQPGLDEETVGTMMRQIEAHPDLERLVRIPLFLSLFVATWQPGAPSPTRRSELIEAYLKTLFRPEEHKAIPRAKDALGLQKALQVLAFRLLEAGEIGAPEHTVRLLLREHESARVSADELFDDAVRCGVLRRPGHARLAFPFPIVQEYLAGLELVETRREEIQVRAQRAAERPWAQAVQFALERLADASEVVVTLLAEEDDAFATNVRLLARCHLNGMRCRPELRDQIGDRLAKAWPYQGYWTAKGIGKMLHDGWIRPLRAPLRAALHQHALLHDGADEILRGLRDPELTLSVLTAYTARPRLIAHLSSFQLAVNDVASQALPIYLAAAKRLPPDEVWTVAALISHLPPNVIPEADLRAAYEDETVPPGVRIATWGLSAKAPDDLYWALARTCVTSDKRADHLAAPKALQHVPDAEHWLDALLRLPELDDDGRRDIIDYAWEVLGDNDRRASFFRALSEDAALSNDLRFELRLMTSGAGDRSAFDAVLDDLPQLSVVQLGHLARMLNEWRRADDGERLVAELRTRPLTSSERASLAGGLQLGISYRWERPGFRASALHLSAPHPAHANIAALIAEWWQDGAAELPNCLKLAVIATRARAAAAGAALHRLATEVILREDVRGHENPLNGGIREAIDELAREATPLSLDVLIHLAENSDSNALLGAIYHFPAIGSRAALDYLVERYSWDTSNRMIVFENIERIATRLGLRVMNAAGTLTVAD